jgi:hypothetical protein
LSAFYFSEIFVQTEYGGNHLIEGSATFDNAGCAREFRNGKRK